jgi:hypothetical protein
LVRPAWAQTWRCKSSPEQVTAREGKRKGGRATDRLEEAWNEPAGRWTRTGYEALPTGASGPMSAKLPWPRGSGVNPAVVRGRFVFLPGEISPHA